jgi:endonuclease G
MKFNSINGASSVSVLHAKYGTDASSSWELWYSTNSGNSWTKTGVRLLHRLPHCKLQHFL